MWCYEHYTLQGIFLTLQLIVVVGWIVCMMSSLHASTPELAEHYKNAAITHVDLSCACTFFVILFGLTKFGTTPFFPKFIAYDAED